MAKLLRGTYAVGEEWISLTPLAVTGGDSTEYEFCVSSEIQDGHSPRQYSTAGWQMEQMDLWYLARICSQARILMTAVVPTDIWHNQRPSKAYLFASVNWLEMLLVGIPGQQHVRIAIYHQFGEDKNNYKRSLIQARVDDVCRFGDELEREIINAAPGWAAENGFA
jgi:hypothetical protein